MTLGTFILLIGAIVLLFDRHPILGALCLIALFF
jgi:hypothetical protein